MKFRKKPVVIEAVRAGSVLDDISNSLGKSPPWIVDGFRGGAIGFGLHDVIINTLEGQVRAQRTDWIIRGVKGEIYPCRPDIFEATYEVVD